MTRPLALLLHPDLRRPHDDPPHDDLPLLSLSNDPCRSLLRRQRLDDLPIRRSVLLAVPREGEEPRRRNGTPSELDDDVREEERVRSRLARRGCGDEARELVQLGVGLEARSGGRTERRRTDPFLVVACDLLHDGVLCQHGDLVQEGVGGRCEGSAKCLNSTRRTAHLPGRT